MEIEVGEVESAALHLVVAVSVTDKPWNHLKLPPLWIPSKYYQKHESHGAQGLPEPSVRNDNQEIMKTGKISENHGKEDYVFSPPAKNLAYWFVVPENL